MGTTKKRAATLALGAALTIFGISFWAFPSEALAWDNCPKGLVNDYFPGACTRYVDTNGDDICDLSQSEPAASTTTTAPPPSTTTTTEQLAATTAPAVATTTSSEPPTGDCPLGPCVGCGACLSIGSVVSLASSDDSSADEEAPASGTVTLAAAGVAGVAATTSTTIPPSGGGGDSSADTAATTISTTGGDGSTQASSSAGYNVSPIALGFFLIYAASFVLHKTRKIKVTTHRKVWNVLLLGTFLITGIFGLVLTIQLDYTLPFAIPVDLLFWHVEAGVAMTLISLFHVGWHLNYYRNLLRHGKRRVRVAHAVERGKPVYDEESAREARERRRSEREARRRLRRHPDLAPGPVQASGRTQSPRSYLPRSGRLEPETQ